MEWKKFRNGLWRTKSDDFPRFEVCQFPDGYGVALQYDNTWRGLFEDDLEERAKSRAEAIASIISGTPGVWLTEEMLTEILNEDDVNCPDGEGYCCDEWNGGIEALTDALRERMKP
jgi:hypothetical protein